MLRASFASARMKRGQNARTPKSESIDSDRRSGARKRQPPPRHVRLWPFRLPTVLSVLSHRTRNAACTRRRQTRARPVAVSSRTGWAEYEVGSRALRAHQAGFGVLVHGAEVKDDPPSRSGTQITVNLFTAVVLFAPGKAPPVENVAWLPVGVNRFFSGCG